MNVLTTTAPASLNYELMSTNQGDLEVRLVPFTPGGGGSSSFQASLNAGPALAPTASADSTATSIPNPLTEAGSTLIVLVQEDLQAADETPQIMLGTVELFMSVDGGVTFPIQLNPAAGIAAGRWWNQSDIPGVGTHVVLCYACWLQGPVASSDGNLWFRVTTTNTRGNGINLVPGELDLTFISGASF